MQPSHHVLKNPLVTIHQPLKRNHAITTLFCNLHCPSTFQAWENPSHQPHTPVPHATQPLGRCKAMAHLIHHPSLPASKLVATSSHPLLGSTPVKRSMASQIDGPDAYTWNCIMRGYLDRNNPKEAILAYAHVARKGLKMDSYTLLFAIKACGLISGAFEGGQIHGQIFKMGFEAEIITQTALVRMYGLFGDLVAAQRIFDETPLRDSVLWNALIATYAQTGHSHQAISVSCAMIHENVGPNEVTTVSILSACSSLRDLKQGKMVHGFVIKCIMSPDVFVHNALIGMYAKCRCLSSAHWIFKRMAGRNVVSWTSMINSYSENDQPYEALALFRKMESANVKPDGIALLGLVSMCSKLGHFELAEEVDHYIKINGHEDCKYMANALMDMHSKCGNMKEACRIFSRMAMKTLVSWTIMIQGLAMHGHGIEALVRFSQMQREGLRPDSIIFLSILSACSHSGLVDEGWGCFRSMIEDHGLTPWKEHYGCMLDLLCRAGRVNEAFDLIERMPMKPDVVMWRTLVGACKNQENIALARQVMGRLLELEPKDSGNYILISNLYATIGEWDNAMEVRNKMEIHRVIKGEPGYTLIAVNNMSIACDPISLKIFCSFTKSTHTPLDASQRG